ncbi:hypothetical protein OBBRIDRAFT_807867 [Obba rivulosa]|uniref:Uncharacterized protein n=1 Tax=Obba rivulosa TaxID=1052685 RepID=A0A8E2DJQ0_9APHY|nr:hypothetical protein OBBRIDRAFT_807867 [Obba rivulosa]
MAASSGLCWMWNPTLVIGIVGSMGGAVRKMASSSSSIRYQLCLSSCISPGASMMNEVIGCSLERVQPPRSRGVREWTMKVEALPHARWSLRGILAGPAPNLGMSPHISVRDVRALQDSTQDVFLSFPPDLHSTKHPFEAPTAPVPPVAVQMASSTSSLHSHLSPSAITQVLEGYSTTSVLLRFKVHQEPTFDPDEMHLWLGWASRTRTLVGKTLFDSYAQLLRSTNVPIPMSFSFRQISSVTIHIDFGLTRMHNAPRMMFLLERLRLWHLAYVLKQSRRDWIQHHIWT